MIGDMQLANWSTMCKGQMSA